MQFLAQKVLKYLAAANQVSVTREMPHCPSVVCPFFLRKMLELC